jgi:repressor LexA
MLNHAAERFVAGGRFMTKRQQEILAFIRDFQEKHGFPPSQREIAQHFDITVRAVFDHLKAIEKKGAIKRFAGSSRGIQLIDQFPAKKLRRVPIVGRIAAGRPILAEENVEDDVVIDGERFSNGAHFVVKVQGDSMIEEHIVDGDLAIIKQQAQVEQGEIAAVEVDGEVTLKKLYRTARGIELRPANKNYHALVVTSGEVRVLGKYCGLIRVKR